MLNFIDFSYSYITLFIKKLTLFYAEKTDESKKNIRVKEYTIIVAKKEKTLLT